MEQAATPSTPKDPTLYTRSAQKSYLIVLVVLALISFIKLNPWGIDFTGLSEIFSSDERFLKQDETIAFFSYFLFELLSLVYLIAFRRQLGNYVFISLLLLLFLIYSTVLLGLLTLAVALTPNWSQWTH